MFGNNHHLQPSWNVDTFPTVVESCACTIYFKKKQRREWCISSSRKWLAKNPACSNLSILGRICFSFWVCQPGNTTPWRRRCPKECPQEGPIDRCSMRPSDLGIAQHLRSTLTSWILAPSAPHTHIHNSIISIHAYMSSYEMMDTWWHLVSACSLQNCQVAHGLIAQIEKEETHASGKNEKKNSPSLWIPVIRCQEFAPLVWQIADIRTYLHPFAQWNTAIQVEWHSLVNICWNKKTWNLKARESKWKCQCFQGCKEWSLRG